MNRYHQADCQKSIPHPISRTVPVSACPRVWSLSPVLSLKGSSAPGDIFAMPMWCFCLSTRQTPQDSVRGLRPPERLGCDFQPLLLHCSGRDAYAEYYSGHGGDFVLCLAGADGSRRRSTTARKSLDGTVSPAMLTLPRKWLSLPLAALRDIAAPSLLGNGEGVKGDASPRQGAGSV